MNNNIKTKLKQRTERKALSGVEKLEERIKGFSSVYDEQELLFKIIDDSLELTSKYKHPKMYYLRIAKTKADLIKTFFLRSIVYEEEGYEKEFPRVKTGMEFDDFESSSITVLQERDNILLSSFRIALDLKNGLPSEKYSPEIQELKKKSSLMEVSRMVVLPEAQKLATVLLDDLIYVYKFAIENDISKVIYEAPEQIVDMYEKMLGKQICLNPHVTYGQVDKPLKLISWDINKNVNPKFLQKAQKRCIK